MSRERVNAACERVSRAMEELEAARHEYTAAIDEYDREEFADHQRSEAIDVSPWSQEGRRWPT